MIVVLHQFDASSSAEKGRTGQRKGVKMQATARRRSNTDKAITALLEGGLDY
jgi:hypothetical protein